MPADLPKRAGPERSGASSFGCDVLILTPTGRDAESAAKLLAGRGLSSRILDGIEALAAALDESAGAVLVTEEAFRGADLRPLEAALDAQPAWSDIPFAVLASRRRGPSLEMAWARASIPARLTNVMVLERPLSSVSLLSAVEWALAARQRQFTIRDQVAELERRAEQLRASESALRDSQGYLRDLLTSSGEAFYAVDRSGTTTVCNRAFLRLMGIAREEEAIGRRLHDVIHHTHLDGSPYPKAECPIYRAAATGEPAHVEDEYFFRLDGTAVPVEYWANPVYRDGVLSGAICNFIDVTERRAAEAQLRQSERELREQTRALMIINRTGTAVAADDDLGRLVRRVLDAGVELTGAEIGAFFYTVDDVPADGAMLHVLSGVAAAAFAKFPMPQNTAAFAQAVADQGVLRADDITADPIYRSRAAHQGILASQFPVRSYLAVPVMSRAGGVLGALFFGHAEAGQFEARMEMLMEGLAAEAAIAIDNARLFQASRRELERRRRAEEDLRQLNETLEQRVAAAITERQEAEERLRQAQKMEAVGQLTGGIAHDFNNMLTGIIGSIDIMKRRIATGRTGDLQRFMDAASASAQRAAALTHRLLAFSRRQSLDVRPVDVNALVEGLAELLRRTISEQVKLGLALAPALPLAKTDGNQLESAILNLAINARDAMPAGGDLTIETALSRLDAAYASRHPDVRAGDYVMLAVSDTGVGMSKEILAKVFDPFFTTKPLGQGTGLGLSMIYGFVKQAQGHIRIHSQPGQGTSVKLYLPIASAEADRPAEAAPEAPNGAGETVLVVEDDPSVRILVIEVLAELGYVAREAGDANAAIPLLQSDERIDLLVTDVGLPGMNGRQLAEIARSYRPGLGVLFMTGYAENATIRANFLAPGMEMITKPFAMDGLAIKIKSMMERVLG